MWNAKRARALALVALGGGLWLSGCKQASPPIQPSIFTNPNELTLVCFSTDTEADDPTLPLDCCDGVIDTEPRPVDENGDGEPDIDKEGMPVLKTKEERCGSSSANDTTGYAAVSHALVTQVQRGEVAAVDLVEGVILDSDKRIPGYTFVDVGGLPAAIAVRSGRAYEEPLWTYVAGRERNSIRAVATCRFKKGEKCGPELEVASDETERALAGEPFDMQLAADEQGLWVTLPDAGLLAYVPLPERADNAPFAGDIVYYPLPGGFDAKPSLPEPETQPYRFACRFDETKAKDGGFSEVDGEEIDGGIEPAVKPDMSDPAPWEADKQVMPLSVPAASTRVARPTLLRMVDLNPRGESDPTRKLLFVADDGQMALHAYASDEAGNLALLGSMPVGAPLRDFAVTPEVPAVGPSYARLLTDAYYNEPRATVRYVYAIDERDGSLMAFSLAFEAGVPKLVPLLAPTPSRDIARSTLNRADRFSLGQGQDTQARALEVIDTRLHRRADGSFDDAYCKIEHEKGRSFLEDREAKLESLGDEADKAQDAFEDEDGATEENRRAWLLAAADLAVPTAADASALRGVFLSVATTSGALTTFDIHDLDLECRAKLKCAEKPDVETGVVLARHTPRLSGTEIPTLSVSPAEEVARLSKCPDGYELLADRDNLNRACVSKDPWLAQGVTFSVGYEGAFTGAIPDGVLEDAGDGRLLLKAPDGVDLCARGANAEDEILVGIVSPPDDAKLSGGRCEVTSFGAVLPRLRVLEARRDELLLEPLPKDADAETLLACYRHLVAFDLRLDDQYLVRSDIVGYQHRNMSAADGTCIRNEALDVRYTSRASLDEPFVNQFLSFTLTARGVSVDAGAERPDGGLADGGEDGEDGGVDEEDGELSELELARRREVNPSITLSSPRVLQVAASIFASNSGRNDVLPHRVRYFPANNYLFVVDQASQGLRRFLLHPKFQADDESNFR